MAWEVSGYRLVQNLEEETAINAMVNYSKEDLGSMVEDLGGDDVMMA